MADDSGHGTATMQTVHRKRLETLRGDMISVARNAVKISQAISQVLEGGGTLKGQLQMSHLMGALVHSAKNFGVIEFLQGQGVAQKKPIPTK